MTRFSTSHLGYTITVESETAGNPAGFAQALFNRCVDLLLLSLREGVPEAIEARTFPEPGDSLEGALRDEDRTAEGLGLTGEGYVRSGHRGSFPLQRVESSVIAGIAYDAPDRSMVLAFTNGKVYLYQGVDPDFPQSIRTANERGESAGRLFNEWKTGAAAFHGSLVEGITIDEVERFSIQLGHSQVWDRKPLSEITSLSPKQAR